MPDISPGSIGLATFQLLNGLDQADNIRRAGDLQQSINEFNAEFAELDSYNAWKSGLKESNRYAAEVDKSLAEQQVAFAVNDVDVTYGTAAKVVQESKLTAFLNQLDIQNKAFADANNYKRQAVNYRLGGGLARAQAEINASATQSAAIMNAGSTLLSGYGKK